MSPAGTPSRLSDRNIRSDPSFEVPCGVHAENPDAA